MEPISWSAAILILIKELPAVIELARKLATLLNDQAKAAAFAATLERFEKAWAASQASAQNGAVTGASPAGNTSALEQFFQSGGKK